MRKGNKLIIEDKTTGKKAKVVLAEVLSRTIDHKAKVVLYWLRVEYLDGRYPKGQAQTVEHTRPLLTIPSKDSKEAA